MQDILDIMIYETGDGGDLNLLNDDIETVQGITNQVYLALFGGNVAQVTSEELSQLEQRGDWWGNEYLESEHQFNSNFEKTINEIALTSNGISKLEDAAKSDLEYLQQYAEITITGFITDVNKFTIEVNLKQPDNNSLKIQFIWDGTRKEVVQTIII